MKLRQQHKWTIIPIKEVIQIEHINPKVNGEEIQKMKLNRGLNAHDVLGQEFDKVFVLVGSTHYSNDQNSIAVRNANYYDPERMFYQSVTRYSCQKTNYVVECHSYHSEHPATALISHKSFIFQQNMEKTAALVNLKGRTNSEMKRPLTIQSIGPFH
ncbi:hypothetical protein [Pueribacillus theae]|uniref:hypothetical protein n=1 Tax=Pueribacillus theae TaxID=2171751 RepID=UPI001F0CCF1D|nr:hypothetical protein [Pueribacillus theae]